MNNSTETCLCPMIKIDDQCKNYKEINYSSGSTSTVAPLIHYTLILIEMFYQSAYKGFLVFLKDLSTG